MDSGLPLVRQLPVVSLALPTRQIACLLIRSNA
jgi:hypothetical protein